MSTGESAHTTGEQTAVDSAGAALVATDSITILKCDTGTASKRVIACPGSAPVIEDYNAGFKFFFMKVPVSNLKEMSEALRAAETVPRALVIRGAPRAGLEPTKPHQRLKTNYVTPPAGRRWILIDVDKIALPPGMSLHQDVDAVCEYVVGLLPDEFHDVSYHWQLSSRAGLGDPAVVSMHLWFWLNRPIPDVNLKRWGKWWNERSGKKIIDTALFNDVQAHYTAAPLFVGMTNPFPVRSGLRSKGADEVALKLPPVSARKTATRAASVESSGGFDEILSEIGDHPGGQGFHNPIIRAAASYVSTHGRDETNVEALYEVIRTRVLEAEADRAKHDDAYVDEMASREHIMAAITTALDKFGNADNPRRKSRLIDGIAPRFKANPISVEEASRELKAVIDDFFRKIP
jgi:hypothetical protein